MDSITGFALGEANRGKELMVFDWEQAARLIRERGAKSASAGLASDWEYTGGEILTDGKPTPVDETHVYLASTWATPELEIDDVRMDCYRMQSETPGWSSDTYWPEEALAILNAAALDEGLQS
jgi:hypothetical protein